MKCNWEKRERRQPDSHIWDIFWQFNNLEQFVWHFKNLDQFASGVKHTIYEIDTGANQKDTNNKPNQNKESNTNQTRN